MKTPTRAAPTQQKPSYHRTAELFDGWRDAVLSGKGPVLHPLGVGELSRIEAGPGLVTLFGGGPGAGKTALTMQLVFDGLRMTPTLRVLVCNIEMSPTVILDRQLARLSGIDLDLIRFRRLGGEHAERIERGLATIESIADRLCFVRAPFDLGNVAAAGDDFNADVIVLDYIQRIRPPGEHADKRVSVDATMNYLRQFADAGRAVVVVSALSRTKDRGGRSSYDSQHVGLASFKESGELEYGADSAWIVAPGKKDDCGVTLRHLKDRNGDTRDMPLTFHKALQRFAATESPPSKSEQGRIDARLAAAWNRTAPEGGDGAGD